MADPATERRRAYAAEQERPWSPDEVQEQIPGLQRRQHEVLIQLKKLGRLASEAKWRYEHHRARATLQVEGGNQEVRKAEALLFPARNVKYTDEETGEIYTKPEVRVSMLGLEADIAERRYQDTRAELRAIENDLDIMRSLLVSFRDSSAAK